MVQRVQLLQETWLAQTAVAAVFLVLVAGAAASTWQAIRATAAEAVAVAERDRAIRAQQLARQERDRAVLALERARLEILRRLP